MAVADDRGFASAARRLGVSPTAATRAVAALERRLGCVLLFRSTRGVSLTDAGERYVQDCGRILAELAVADDTAAGAYATPRGQLSLAAPSLLGQLVLTPLVASYLASYPEVSVDLRLSDRPVHLHEERVDVAVLVGDLPDSSLVAYRVGAIRRIVCASPSYLAERGIPRHPRDLPRHDIVLSTADARTPHWRFIDQDEITSVALQPRLMLSTNQSAIVAASAGAGLTRVMSYQVANELAQGTLVAVLTDFALPALSVHLGSRDGRRAPAKVRCFIEHATAAMREHPALRI